MAQNFAEKNSAEESSRNEARRHKPRRKKARLPGAARPSSCDMVVVGLGIPALLTPWGFYMGGSLHLIPVWYGWGRMHSNTAGGDYVIQVSFYPKVGRYFGPRHVDGNAWLCTPRGEKLRLHLGGDFQKDLKLDTNGKTASFYMNSYNLKTSSPATPVPAWNCAANG